MDERRRTWWIWLLAGVVLVIALAIVAWLLIGPNASNTSAPVTASPMATSRPTQTLIPTKGAPDLTPTPTAPATPAPTATATPTPTAEPVPTETTAPPQAGAVAPFIVSAGWDPAAGGISVSATVPGITEADGTCTLTATRGDQSISQTFPASASAAATDCGTNTLSWAEFSAGEWSVVVHYESPLSSGETSTTVVIP